MFLSVHAFHGGKKPDDHLGKNRKNSVRLKLKLQDQEPADSFTAFSLKLIFESDEPMSEDPAFKFSQNIKSKLDPAVYETRYDEDAQEMTVYVADRDPVLEKGEELDLGTITVDSEENVRISVDRDDFQGVNSFHEKLEVTNFGEYEDYEMILETPEPEEPETEDPETPEPEAPDTPDEDTEDDDSDRNSGRGNSRSEWTEKPNGSWKAGRQRLVVRKAGRKLSGRRLVRVLLERKERLVPFQRRRLYGDRLVYR